VRPIVIVPTGIANTASVATAFTRIGAQPKITHDAAEIDRADQLVIPGVGSFGAAVAALDRLGLRPLLSERLANGRPTLAICVGMQLLAKVSSESPKAAGLGFLPGDVSRFPEPVQAPQLGWNVVSPDPHSRYLEAGWAYFANSYRLTEVPDGWAAATTDHGGTFVSALERGNLLACQFHPELSGAWGSQLLTRWMTMSQGVN
jgi:imidazole glycerol-phosphate synthase subunit HisH